MPVALRTQRRLRVVQVQAAEPLEADLARTLSTTASIPAGVRMSIPDANRWQESRHRPSRASAPGGIDQRRELLDRAPERAAGARGVLEVQRQPSSPTGLADRLARSRDRGVGRRLLRRAGVQHDARRADPAAEVERAGE